MKKIIMLLCAGLALCGLSDEARLKDGTVIKGTVITLNDKIVEIKTAFAGTLKIDRALMSSLSTDEPVHVRLADGRTMSGVISSDEQGGLEIAAEPEPLTVPVAALHHTWTDPDDDPVVLARKALQRSWIYQIALNMNGSSGNTEKNQFGADVSAMLSGSNDELRLYALYSTSENDGEKSSDELKGGFRYANYLNGSPWGLYLREQLEQDEFENISLRSVTAGGLSIRLASKEHFKLSGNAGLGYRWERYDDETADSGEAGLDFGVHHFYLWENRLKMNNEISYLPVLSDFTTYLISQNSSLDFPVPGSDRFKVRLGVRNDYNSQPGGDRKKLDTTYYTSLVADWN